MLFRSMSVPFWLLVVNPKSRLWLKSGIEGDNRKLDIDEIQLMIKFIIMSVCLVLLSFMVFTTGLLDAKYPTESWFIVAAVTVGAGGAVFSHYFGRFQKKGEQPNERTGRSN